MTRGFAILSGVFSGLCFVWVFSVPVYYCVTSDGDAIVQMTRSILDSGAVFDSRIPVGLVFLFLQFFAIPYGLCIAVLAARPRLGSPVRQGVFAGLCYGMWANTVFLAIPYLGAYPSIFGFGLATLWGKGASLRHLPLLASNMFVAVLFGVVLGFRRMQARRR